MELTEFIDRARQRPLPRTALARIRALARDLAEGAAEGLWNVRFYVRQFEIEVNSGAQTFILPEPETIQTYLYQKWGGYDKHPAMPLLLSNGYLQIERDERFWTEFSITQAAFALMEDIEPSSIFISYRRGDSSAFALLLLTRLKQAGLEPFLDLALVPGEDWNAGLKQRIQQHDFFVILLGKETLRSPFVVNEITWAVEAGKTIIPIWHNGFEYRPGGWQDIPVRVDRALTYAHTIRVVEENPLAYNNAVLELLNRFGYTPVG